MYRPLKINTATSPISLKEMTDSEIENTFVNQILIEFAGDNTGTGAIRNASFGGTNDLIGTWSDRNRVYNVGQHGFTGVDNFTTRQYSVYQNLSPTSEVNMVRPICYKYLYKRTGSFARNASTISIANTEGLTTGMDLYASGIPTNTIITNVTRNTSIQISNQTTAVGSGVEISFRRALVQMNNDEIDQYIIAPALDKMVNQGLGSYHFSTTAPTEPTGGTWTSKFSLIDRWKPTNSATKTMWRLTDITGLPSITARPLKYTEGDVNVLGDEGLREMTDTDIRSLVARFKNRILATGKGLYAFQQFAPATGTWAQVGESINDLLNVISNESYLTEYTGFYKADYRKNYFGDYIGYYVGFPWVGTYRTSKEESFGGKIRYYKGTAYSGVYATTYAGTYVGTYTNYRSAQIAHGYTSYFTGATVSSDTASSETDALWIRRA